MKKHIHKFGAHVDPNVGKNPIARAIAKQKLIESVRTAKIAVYLLEDGEGCSQLLSMPQIAVNATYMALDTLRGQTVEVRQLRSAIVVLNEAQETNKWRMDYAHTISHSLDIVQREYPNLPMDIANKATMAAFQIHNQGNQLDPSIRKAA